MRSEQESARWHRKEDGYAQYLSLTSDGAWAEFIRARRLSTPAQASHTLRDMYVCYVVESDIADWRSPAQIRQSGLDPSIFVGAHGPCQALGAWLVSRGFRGVLAPNAALEGEVNLTLFGFRYERHLNPWEHFGGGPPLDADEIEIRMAEHGAHPPEALLARTKLRGASPDSYAIWASQDAGLPTRPNT